MPGSLSNSKDAPFATTRPYRPAGQSVPRTSEKSSALPGTMSPAGASGIQSGPATIFTGSGRLTAIGSGAV